MGGIGVGGGVTLIGFLTLPPSLLSSLPFLLRSGTWERKEDLSSKKEKENIFSSGHPTRASLGTGTGFLVFCGEGRPTDESA